MILLDLADHLTGQLAALATPAPPLPLAAPGHPSPGDAPLPGTVDNKLATLVGWSPRLAYVAAFS